MRATLSIILSLSEKTAEMQQCLWCLCASLFTPRAKNPLRDTLHTLLRGAPRTAGAGCSAHTITHLGRTPRQVGSSLSALVLCPGRKEGRKKMESIDLVVRLLGRTTPPVHGAAQHTARRESGPAPRRGVRRHAERFHKGVARGAGGTRLVADFIPRERHSAR